MRFSITVVSALLSVLFSVSVWSETILPPRIEFTETMVDFGKVNEGETLTHVFHFKNTGGEKLIIHKLKAP